MANRTVKDATSIKGTNPQYLVEKIIRSRIYDSRYWKEECFALSAELLVDKAMQLKYVGGVFGGNIKPTPFLCLVLKMLQIQPEKDIIVEFIKNEDFKYVRALGAYYMRLTGTSLDCFKYLEPLLNDYRKLRSQNRQGVFELTFMDEFVDQLLREERMCDVILPRIQRRQVHEENNELEPRVSALDDDLDELAESSGEDEPPLPPRSKGRAREPGRRREHREHRGEHRSDHRADFRGDPRAEHRGERREHREHRADWAAPERPEKRHRGDYDNHREHRGDYDNHREHRGDYDNHREHRGDYDNHREHRGEHDGHREHRSERERREHRAERRHHREERREERRGRHRGEEERREIEEANALRAKLGLPPLRP
ncbi:pre-mRNA-splicing factor 38A-like [Pollicipes pollicipes]|uniref:pre-mRNA-splicing factor 38A-like n=1 Tax=Pollicipes pollicipes TaxID=41117 RepID=UPI001885799E|nr:pre-mRNA-splicing factor 38A-like [Pollicipes pollicipes]